MEILVADDHPVVRSGLKEIIESRAGMSVVAEARDADEAIELARRVSWDVAVVDYSMPGCKAGVELVKELKRQHPTRPVLVLSMHPENPHGIRSIKAGASGYLNKQSAVDELVTAISKVAAGGRYITPKLGEELANDLMDVAGRPAHETLSDRERKVMRYLAYGTSIKDIGKALFLSPSAVSTYRGRVLRKLKIANNTELVRYTLEHAMVDEALMD